MQELDISSLDLLVTYSFGIENDNFNYNSDEIIHSHIREYLFNINQFKLSKNDSFYDYESNLYTFDFNNKMIDSLRHRKNYLFNKEYLDEYISVHVASFPCLLYTEKYNIIFSGIVNCFFSISRMRQVVISVWFNSIKFEKEKISKEERINFISMLSRGDKVFVEYNTKQKDDIYFCPPLLFNLINKSNTITSFFKIFFEWTEDFWFPVFKIRSSFLKYSNKGNENSDTFLGILCSIDEPLPNKFDKNMELVKCRSLYDWHCSAASLLPYVISNTKDYFPEYLHDLLGIDLSDVSSAHYFIGQRTILSIYDSSKTNNETIYNLMTWTQFLSESASIQLNALYSHDYFLDIVLKKTKKKFVELRKILNAKWNNYLDLEEYFNILVAKNPIFWKHLNILKEKSDITILQSTVEKKYNIISDISSSKERRILTILAQIFTIIFGIIGFVSFSFSFLSKIFNNSIILIYFTIFLLFISLLLGLGFIYFVNKKI